ncbi:Uncharacterised protein [Mycobacteroides abscessus]|nr:Uncharacterised protein [Mycobacteroides abscessus]
MRRSLNHADGLRKKFTPLLAEKDSTRKTHKASKYTLMKTNHPGSRCFMALRFKSIRRTNAPAISTQT